MPKDINARSITFHFQAPFSLAARKKIRELLIRLFGKEKKEFESLTYIFCTDDYLLEINKRFLKHDFYTDIITFDLGTAANSGIVGEIYISIDRVRENARQHQTTVKEEVMRVILHGALHLCGYKDKARADTELMRKAEDQYLGLFKKMFHVKHQS
ncbi:MAG: rRNA maturation RNase YbeY [Sphingobacteriales bacterium]|nr:MAG: rRNA maturation RNase YbeY [Sphingobacteriales bacterium]